MKVMKSKISSKQLKIERILSIIGTKLYLNRIQKNMSRKEFAKYMGTSLRKVAKWETGNYNFSVSDLVAISEKLNIDLHEFLIKLIIL